MDSQLIELLGQNRLTDELLRAGLEIAQPVRDRGVDLSAYAELDTQVDWFVARPIKLKPPGDGTLCDKRVSATSSPRC